MSHDTQSFGRGLFHELDRKLQEFLEKRGDPEVGGRYELILSNDWASNDCQLDGVSGSILEKAIENHQNATALLMSRPESIVQSLSMIKDVHSMMMEGLSDDAGQFRTGGIVPLTAGHQPPDADGIEAAVGRLLEWVSADSFLELHPVQQAALVLVRLLDIYPFADGTPRTCRVMASSGLIRAGFPPMIFYSGNASLYKQAIEAGLAMDTTGLTTRIAASLARTLEYCLAGTLKPPVT